MRLGIDFVLDEAPLNIEIAINLRSEFGIEVFGSTLGKRWADIVGSSNIPSLNINDYLKSNWDKFDTSPDSLAHYERTYSDTNLFKIVYSDKYCVNSVTGHNCDIELIRKLLVGHFCYWEHFFDSTGAEAFFGPGIQALFDRTRYDVMKRRGLRNLATYCTRMPGGRIVFSDNEYDRWGRVNSLFANYLENGCPEETFNEASNWLASYRAKCDKPDYMKINWKKVGFYKHFRDEFRVRFRRYFFDGWGKEFDFVTPNPFRSLYEKGIRKYVFAKYHARNAIFEMPHDDEKFVFFPLHFQPEATTMLWAPYFEDQLSLIENLAKSIPLDTMLYVKEHSASLGLRPLGYYKRIKHLPNVRLISPYADTFDLIVRSWVNVVITGTVGWESLLLGKPVIVLGEVFFNDCLQTCRLTDTTAFPFALKEASLTKIDDEKLIDFIAAIMKGSYLGYYDVPHQNPKIMDSHNTLNLCNAILTELNYK